MDTDEDLLREKDLVLIGFMGVGKTTIGRALANKLQWDFIDIDEEIEKTYSMPTSQIFQTIGEDAFRAKEKDMIKNYTGIEKLKIISVGGGAFLQDETKKLCLSECIVIFLDISWEVWQDRISLLVDSRPVLQGKTIDEMEKLFYDRQSTYKDHHFRVKTDDYSIDETADFIVDSILKK
ncbi:shikimate kinase [Virgibacillus natechei]|uniref:Shikimate kinase n=1 Tax=Virgibacillus natechei TaxID=1216297 RepID=A0ABS4IFN2_9BACI|nr:shikimate kinase [Virgibacillus natechei]MBP1969425.1 shikimate kinase [Virgibacillus natechei]UZD11863.1 shikimate kinase [Virgibacillus natechei]